MDERALVNKRFLFVLQDRRRIMPISLLDCKQKMTKDNPKRIIVEEPSAAIANDLALSGEYCQPRFSEKRNLYVLIRKRSEQ